MYSSFLESKEIFCDEDKKKCIPTICELIDLAYSTRANGILSLDHYISECDNPFLKQGLELIFNGTDPDLVNAILENFIKAGNYSGFELLSRFIMLEAMLAIQTGEHPKLIIIKLTSMLGENYTLHVNNTLDIEEKNKENEKLEINNFLDRLKNKTSIPESEIFEKSLNEMPYDYFSQLILQPNPYSSWSMDFARALQGCDYNTIHKVFCYLMHTQKMFLFREMSLFENVSKEDIVASQNKILKKYKEIYDSMNFQMHTCWPTFK